MSALAQLAARVRGSSFGRGVGRVAAGTATGQLLTLAVAPLLTRLFSPEHFGTLGLYTSFVGFFAVAVCLRYELAIASTREARDARALTLAALLIALLMAPLGALAFWLVRAQDWLGYGAFEAWGVLAVLVGLLAMGSSLALRYHLVRQESFIVIATTPIVQNVGRAAVQIAAGVSGLGAIGLVSGEIFGRCATAVQLGLSARRGLRRAPEDAGELETSSSSLGARLRAMVEVLRRHAVYPKFALPSGLLDTLAVSIVTPLVAVFHGENNAGLFFLVQRVVTMPVGFVCASVSDVFHGRLARMASETPERMLGFFFRVAGGLLGIGLVFGAVLALVGPWAFELVFGSAWASSGIMATYMAPWAVGQLVVVPLSRVIVVVDAQRAKLGIDVLMLTVSVASFLLAELLGLGVIGAVALLSAGYTLVYALYFLLLWWALARWRPEPEPEQLGEPMGDE